MRHTWHGPSSYGQGVGASSRSPAMSRQRSSQLSQHWKVRMRALCLAAAILSGHWCISSTTHTAQPKRSADCNSCAQIAERWTTIIWRRCQQFPLIVQAPYEMHASRECTQCFGYLVPSLEATLASSSTRRSCGKRTVGVLEAHCPHTAGKLSRRALKYGHRGHSWRLGGIKAKDGGGLLQTVEQGFEQLPHGG
jgi:hypothetical protein